MAQFRLELRDYPVDSVRVVAVRGELDIATAHLLREQLRQEPIASARHLVLDLTELSFMDSSGVHVLMDAARRTRLSLVCPAGQPLDVLELTGVADRFEVFPTFEAAVGRRLKASVNGHRRSVA